MAVSSIGDYYSDLYSQNATGKANNVKSAELENKISNLSTESASDEEMLEACKEFESYLVEQVMKQVKESMMSSDEDDNQYMKVFGDQMMTELASTVTETSNLGIAQSLFESMKRNMPSVNIKPAEDSVPTTEMDTTVEAERAAEKM